MWKSYTEDSKRSCFYKLKGETKDEKTVKYFAAFALCFCILANCLPVQAAAVLARPCTVCGKAAYYSGSEVKNATKIGYAYIDGEYMNVYHVWYEDLYRCGCGALSRFIREEDEYR